MTVSFSIIKLSCKKGVFYILAISYVTKNCIVFLLGLWFTWVKKVKVKGVFFLSESNGRFSNCPNNVLKTILNYYIQ